MKKWEIQYNKEQTIQEVDTKKDVATIYAGNKNWRRNALLISKAPDMYVLLEDLVKAYDTKSLVSSDKISSLWERVRLVVDGVTNLRRQYEKQIT